MLKLSNFFVRVRLCSRAKTCLTTVRKPGCNNLNKKLHICLVGLAGSFEKLFFAFVDRLMYFCRFFEIFSQFMHSTLDEYFSESTIRVWLGLVWVDYEWG